MCDREGDIWELLSRAVAAGAGLVVRACRSKRRRVLCEDGKKMGLYMAEQPVLTRRSLTLAACGGKRARKKREVTLDIRAARVKLVPPGDRIGDDPVSMFAVPVAEPQGLDWLLLATEGEPEKDDAVRIVKWYERRWTEYFRALKWASKTSGSTMPATFESTSPSTPPAGSLQRMARDRPNAPAAEVAEEDEITVLDLAERGVVKSGVHDRIMTITRKSWNMGKTSVHLTVCTLSDNKVPHVHGRTRRPSSFQLLDIWTFVVDVGRLASFISSKRQPLPGTIKLWQGYAYLKARANLSFILT